ncbi:methyltransferase domain-containing protein [Treponema medium]|uniref:Methyltransferase type 12 domain-containing protein n=2 Tax=Treponema medium TaxID=58231 RepID=A0AA87NQD5_TREMD|nr:methyltransferase [Treponema medium]EPF28391.1 hypothetical protein HMPREF9195_01600 [Treponema medium ATCC 700293]QSH97708.1 methyltransferase domain-containing protein [Treponema medium]
MDTVFFDSKAEQWDAHRTRVLRAEEIYKKIIAEIGVQSCNKVLDFGCGTGLLGFHFIDRVAEVSFADISAGMLEQVRKKAAMLRSGNIKTIDLTEHTVTEMYDIIVSLLALHHVEDVEKTVCHLASRVAEGGYLCLSDLDLEDGSFHYPDAAPHNGIDRNAVLNAARKSGMYIICNKTVYTAQKIIDGTVKTYPIFLIIGKRDANRI